MGEPDEIELAGGFFNFTEKYTLETSAIHVPARIPAQHRERVKANAKRIYRALGCQGFARVDQFLTPDGRLVFIKGKLFLGRLHLFFVSRFQNEIFFAVNRSVHQTFIKSLQKLTALAKL